MHSFTFVTALAAALIGSVEARPALPRGGPILAPGPSFLQPGHAAAHRRKASNGYGAARYVHPGDKSDLVINKKTTITGTNIKGTENFSEKPKAVIQSTAQLPLSFVNNYDGGAVNAYVTGIDSQNRAVMLLPDGTFYYPTAGGSATPVAIDADCAIPLEGAGGTTDINLPDFISSGRIWFAEGELQFFIVAGDGGESIVQPSATNLEDPSAGVNWGFVELTNTDEAGIYANISYVDFVGMILGMELVGGDGAKQTTEGLSSDAVMKICEDLAAQGDKDGQPWGELCLLSDDGNPLRILSPTDYGSSDDSAFADYWTQYVDDVWTQYTNNASLMIETQADAGRVRCGVSGDEITCDGENRGYAKPVAADIWGCNSGPFGIEEGDSDVHKAIVPRLCAAFVRSTLLLPGGNVQPGLPADKYYTTNPTNHYSRIVHKYEVDGRGYAFAYDDVNPDGNENASGVVSDPDPQKLTIYVGGAQ